MKTLNFRVGDSVWVSRGTNNYYKVGWIVEIDLASFKVEHSDGSTHWYDGKRLERC
jgi:hypothetical protein